MAYLTVFRDTAVVAPSAEPDALGTWRAAIRQADCRSDCVVYRGFARSAAEIVAAAQSAAKNADATVAFALASTMNSQQNFASAAVVASRLTDEQIDIGEIRDVGETRWAFTPSYDWEADTIGFKKQIWPHELIVTGQHFFPPHAPSTGIRARNIGKKASSESAVTRLIDFVLWADPAIRRALASGRTLSVKWGAGFLPGGAINKSGVCVTKFAVWDIEDDSVVAVGNVTAQAVLNLALRARNLSATREGVISFAREFPMVASLPSATRTAAWRVALLRGGDGAWPQGRALINYLKRLGLTDLARDVAAQADAPARDGG